MQFAVGFKFEGKTGHVVVDAEDALIAALKVKVQRPEERWSHLTGQNGGLAKVDSGFDYAANFSSVACVA